MSTRPLVGVTGMWSAQCKGLRLAGSTVAVKVLQSVVRAGGEPLTLFAESGMDARARVRSMDAILVPGGADLKPATYGAVAEPETDPADYELQDEFEAEIIRAAIAEKVPLLVICRGFQLVNAINGVELIQHVGDESNMHRNGMHDISITEGSRLHAILGETEMPVSSYHHQAIDAAGEGLVATAVAPDGVVEAVESADPEVPFVGIQWHPEDNADTEPRQQALFDWLVEAAAQRREAAAG